MLKITKTAKILFTQLAHETSKDFNCPLILALILQALSQLHALNILFISAFPPSTFNSYKILPFLKDFTSIIAIFPFFDAFSSQPVAVIIWWVSIFYLASLLASLGYLLYATGRGRTVERWVSNCITIALLLHSRVVFYPLHYFLFQTISRYDRCAAPDPTTLECNPQALPVTIIISLLNMAIAISKETSFYRITKGKYSYSCKNNITSQILLILKIVSSLLFLLFQDSDAAVRTSAFINFFTFFALCLILYFKFPFYALAVTKLSLILSGISLVLSFFFIFKAFNALHDSLTLELTLYFTTTLVTCVITKIFENLVYSILRFEFITPEHAVHLPILLEDATTFYAPFPRLVPKFQPKLICYYGLLRSQDIDSNKLQTPNTFEEFEFEIYTVMMERFNKMLKTHPHSKVLRICMAIICMEKLGAAPRAVSLVRNVSLFSNSLPVKISIEAILKRFEKIYRTASNKTNQQLETLNYFKCRDIANVMKADMRIEVNKHIEFWKELTRENVDVYKMIALAHDVDQVFKRVLALWNENYETFAKTFGPPILLYGAHLAAIRDYPQEGWQFIYKYFNIRKNKVIGEDNKSSMGVFSESTAILVGSIEPERLGKIIDASASVRSLFNIDKDKIIGQKINVLMPNFIAKMHDDFIHKYNKKASHQINTHVITLAKTIDGSFFTAETNLRVFPSIKDGVFIMSTVKKVANRDPTFVVGDEGIIVDCSKEVEDIFKIDKLQLGVTKVQQISPEFESACISFDITQGNVERADETFFPQIPNFGGFMEDKLTSEDGMISRDPYYEGELPEIRPLVSREESILNSAKRIGNGNWKLNVEPLGSQNKLASPRISQRSPSGTLRMSFEQGYRYVNPQYIDKDIAITICNKFKEGRKMTLNALGSEKSTRFGQQYHVKMEPFFVNGKFYKLVRLRKYTGSSTKTTRSHIGTETKPKIDDKFADEFPSTYERVAHARIEKEESKDNFTDGTKHPLNLSFNTDQFRGVMDTEKQETETWEPSLSNEKEEKNEGYLVKKQQGYESSSVKDNSHMEGRVLKTLHDVFSNQELRPTTKASMFIVYFAMLAVLSLTVVDYKFSGSSLEEIRGGVIVMDTASKRIYHNIIAWQCLLILYSSAGSATFGFLTNSLYIRTLSLLQENDNLKASLQTLGNMQIVETFFKKRITFWDPFTRAMFNSEMIDSFTATHVLAVKYLFVANFTAPPPPLDIISKVRQAPELIFSMNNTANDYIVVLEQEIAESEKILDDVISKNVTLLRLILTAENIALFLLGASLAGLVKVIWTSYAKMFKALANINQSSVLKRLEKLEAFKPYLDENIELRKFTHNLSKYLEALEKGAKAEVAKPAAHIRLQEERCKFRGLFIEMAKYLTFGVILMLFAAGIFVFSFASAISSFDLLNKGNKKLCTTHQLGYHVDNILSNTAHVMSFYNRTDLTIKNQDPEDMLDINLANLANANLRLLDVLTDGKTGFDDPTIEDFLKNNICSYIPTTDLRYLNCLSSTRDAPGLMSLNAQYSQEMSAWVDIFRRDPTETNGQKILGNIIRGSGSDVLTLQVAYEFLTNRLLEQFQDTYEKEKLQRLIDLLLMLGVVLLTTLLMQIFIINRFKYFDIALRRALKVVPYEIIKENKVFGFFLKQEFEKELGEIKGHI